MGIINQLRRLSKIFVPEGINSFIGKGVSMNLNSGCLSFSGTIKIDGDVLDGDVSGYQEGNVPSVLILHGSVKKLEESEQNICKNVAVVADVVIVYGEITADVLLAHKTLIVANSGEINCQEIFYKELVVHPGGKVIGKMTPISSNESTQATNYADIIGECHENAV